METKQKWLIVTLVTATLLLITIGFTIGYFITDKGCSSNPLVYGIKIMNEANEDYFTCSCTSLNDFSKSFYFDEEGMKESIMMNP